MSFILFNNKESEYTRNINRNDIRKPNVDPSKIGDIMNKPIHLGTRKKQLLKEKKGLLQRIKDIKKKKMYK